MSRLHHCCGVALVAALTSGCAAGPCAGHLIAVGPSPSMAVLSELGARHGLPLVVIHGTAYTATCAGDSRVRAGQSEGRDTGSMSESRRYATNDDVRRRASADENRTIRTSEDARSVGGAADERRVSGAAESRRFGSADESRVVGGSASVPTRGSTTQPLGCEPLGNGTFRVCGVAPELVTYFDGTGLHAAIDGVIP